MGRMGKAAASAVEQDPNLEIASLVDISAKDSKSQPETFSSLTEALSQKGNPDVAVDFTKAESAKANLKILAENGIHAVVGTSGIDNQTIKSLEKDFKKSNCLIAPNFSISAVLMIRMAELAAPYFDSAEIIEMHHESKIDAPSGTAIETLKRMEAASDSWLPDPTTQENLSNARGATLHGNKGSVNQESEKGGIRIHSIRLKGLVAHQEVLLGTAGQSLSIRQDTYDRSAFMPGVLLAIKEIANHPGITVGLDKILGI